MLEPVRMKKLLGYYKLIPAKIKILEQAIQLCENEAGDATNAIYNDSIRQNMSCMPFPPAGNTSDKVLNIVQNYEHDMKAEVQDYKRIKHTMEYLLQQIDLAMETLLPLEKAIVFEHCINGKTYEVIANTLPETSTYSISRLCTFMGKGIDRLCTMVIAGDREYRIVKKAFSGEDMAGQKAESDKEHSE